MSTRCSIVPVLDDPPQLTASGQYVVVVDENNESRILARRTNAVLGQWGDDVYLADGSDNAQIVLDSLTKKDFDQEMMGMIAQTGAGRLVCLFNSTSTEKIAVFVNGAMSLQNKADSSVAATGTGLYGRNTDEDAKFFDSEGLYYVDGAGDVQRVVPPGGDNFILKFINGVPVWNASTVTATSGSQGVTGIDDAYCFTSADDKVVYAVPVVSLTDGVDDVSAGPATGTIDIDSGIALLGTDAALVADKWYYLYVISNDAGTMLSAVASQSSTSPDLTASPFSAGPESPPTSAIYTRWCLIGVCYWDSGLARIVKFIQKGRRFVTERLLISRNYASGITTVWTYITVLKQNERLLTNSVPPIAKSMSGIIGGSSTSTTVNGLATVVASGFDGSSAFGEQYLAKSPADIPGDNFKYDAGTFQDLLIKDASSGAAMIGWKAKAADSNRVFVVNGYSI